MREIHIDKISEVVKKLCVEANYFIGDDIKNALKKAKEEENFPIAEDVLDKIILNDNIAADNKMPMCQDTGMACVFLEIGQEVHFTGGLLEDAINEGVRQGYKEGYLRKSVVGDPIEELILKITHQL